MAVDGVSDFIKSNAVTEAAQKKNNSDLSMDDFFQLMVAQLQNQDMFSPMDNTQFMNQMAQFSMVNALMDMSELSSVSYSTSLIGKQVTVAFLGADGQMGSKTGMVDSVNLYNGSAEVVVGGSPYSLSNVMTVNDMQTQDANPLLAQSDLIGKTAYAMHKDDSGNFEVIEGVITGLQMVDEEVYATVGDKSFPAREISSLKTTATVVSQTTTAEATASQTTTAEATTGGGSAAGAEAATGGATTAEKAAAGSTTAAEAAAGSAAGAEAKTGGVATATTEGER
ncbi:MAG: hypothetical protein LBL49_02345 [Clostridiales Family XIII bacterium]|jgi:flagellar basal-body rod modification protein FlgD|nr:hypothetical protein [Clostridiales Family XIII bacterium]